MTFVYNPQHHIIQKLKFGKQGIVGLVYDKSTKQTRVYKFSSQLNMLGTHEYKVMKSLDTINSMCPFYTKAFELVNLPVNENFEHSDNPFEIAGNESKFILDVCISEYIEKSRKFTTFVHHYKQVNDNIIISILKQVLLASLVAKNKCGLTHYDLHSDNILVQKCSYNDVYVWYDARNDARYVIPTLGYVPRIIDYGFSYSSALDGTPITTPLDFMKEGYTSIKTDEFSDFRICLVSILEDFYHYRPESELFDVTKRIVKKTFKKLNLDWESGWFIDNKSGASKFLFESMIKNPANKAFFASPTIEEHFYSILGLLQLLMDNPLKSDPLPDKSMTVLFEEFLFGFKEFHKHFVKLEHAFEKNVNYKNEKEYEPNPNMGLYIIRCTIECMLKTRDVYLNSAQPKDAVRKFQNLLFDSIRINKKLFDPKINYEKYMVSIYVMANTFQSLLYKEYAYRKQYIDRQHQLSPVTSSNDLFYLINRHLGVPYHYTENSRIIYINEEAGCSQIYKLDQDQCLALNTTGVAGDLENLMFKYIGDMKPVIDTTKTSIQTILAENSATYDSPTNKVGMNDWSDSEDSDLDSDDEDFDVKYDWTLADCTSSPLRPVHVKELSLSSSSSSSGSDSREEWTTDGEESE